jgi:3-deoxy-D-manno-octulosonic acid kinase
MLHHASYSDYHFAARYQLTIENLSQLVQIFQYVDSGAASILGGRRPISRTHLNHIGAVVVKHYRRGGLLGNLVKNSYLATGKKRCQSEFEQMDAARRLGVSVPEPILYAYKGHLLYHAWLVTREIEQSQSMAQISRTEPDRAAAVMQSIVREISVLIEHLILHADFHPGNVLIDKKDQVFIIDFDKAAPFAGSKEMLRRKYRQRWCRAVRKHGLPEMLCEKLHL